MLPRISAAKLTEYGFLYFVTGLLTTAGGPLIGSLYGLAYASSSNFQLKVLNACFGELYTQQHLKKTPKNVARTQVYYSQIGEKVVKRYLGPCTMFFRLITPSPHITTPTTTQATARTAPNHAN